MSSCSAYALNSSSFLAKWVHIFDTVVANRDLISSSMYFTLNSTGKLISIFNYFVCKNCHFFSFKSCNFFVRTKKLSDSFCPWKHKKLDSKVAYLWQFGFFSLQPWLLKTDQDRKFILEMCLKTHLFSNLWFSTRYCGTEMCKEKHNWLEHFLKKDPKL